MKRPRIEGYAVISREGMIAASDGHFPDELKIPADHQFYQDSLDYDAFDAPFVQPTIVFQGLRDASVDYRTVEQFAGARPNVTLSLVDDDHQLTASLPRMWTDIAPFLGLV
jgi:hypothetical protein